MSSPYRDWLDPKADGRIWWTLSDAAKLVAGFRVVESIYGSILQPPNGRATLREGSILAAVRHDHGLVVAPRLVPVEGKEFVMAMEFLNWYAGYLLETDSEEVPPTKLAQAVADAEADARKMPRFQSLVGMLGDWWDKPLAALPHLLAEKVARSFGPHLWDGLSPEQRRISAQQWDLQNDPARGGEHAYWWDMALRKHELMAEIKRWEVAATPTATDMEIKERKLKELRQALRDVSEKPVVKRSTQLLKSAISKPKKHAVDTQPEGESPVPYPQALNVLARRLNARPVDVAGWVYFGPENGGLRAYVNANELGYEAQFSYQAGDGDDFDYLGPLMATWFRPSDLESFNSKERFVTGAELVARWGDVPGIAARPFIRAKVQESRLLDFNPIVGGTRWSDPGNAHYPSEDEALFRLADIVSIERADFPKASPEPQRRPRTGGRNADLQRAAEDLVQKLRRKNKRLKITKRQVAEQLASSDEWSEFPAVTIERLIRVAW